jgi:predicted Zn-dependent protease
MEARLQGEDLEGLEQGLKEYVLLPSRDLYADRLSKMKEQAAKQQAKSKTPVLSKNIQARFSELQALIDRYLDNEAFQSYTEALERKRSERAGATATKGSSKRQLPAAPAPVQSSSPGETARSAGPGPSAQPQGPSAQPKTDRPPY